MRIFIAIPSFDGKICFETVRSLLIEQGAAGLAGHELQHGLLPGCSLITQARNQLVRDFLSSDCERLVFVDADVAWSTGELLRIATHPVDFVGGVYRFKEARERYPVHWIEERAEIWADKATGLIEVALIPCGFMSLSRDVFVRLAGAFPERAYNHAGEIFHAYFHCPPGDGEDGTFCREWREQGGQVWLDPELTLTHVGGSQAYTGRVGALLKAMIPAPEPKQYWRRVS
jgi:hypothetical protein